MPIFAPYQFKSGDITTESNDGLLKIVKLLSKKIDNDNLSGCSFSGMANNVLNFIDISKELVSRKLSIKEKEKFDNLSSDYQDLLLNFELFCVCNNKTRSEFMEFIKKRN